MSANLRLISFAVDKFETRYRRLPHDLVGRRKGLDSGLSWRVSLLPMLGYNKLYDEFRLTEPWDSTHNKALLSKMPSEFMTSTDLPGGHTTLRVFASPGTLFERGKRRSWREIKDDHGSTVLAVIAGERKAVEWTRPGGLTWVPGPPSKSLGTADETFRCLFADGSVRALTDATPIDEFRQLIHDGDGSPERKPPPMRSPPRSNGPDDGISGLKKVARAFQSHHDTCLKFPRYNGDANGMHTGLSWRVHLLPYLDEPDLYKEFHLDEPWDSLHNTKLISRMPKVFASAPDLKPGYTTIHVFRGDGTPMNGPESGPRIRDFSDGLRNTILAVVTGASRADCWTRPTAIEYREGDIVRRSLGLSTPAFSTIYADGSVKEHPSSLSPADFFNLIRHRNGD